MEDLEDLKGQFYEGEYWPEGQKRRSRLRYQMYLPVGVDTTKPLALVLAFDNFNKPACRAVETLIAEGAMPPAVYLSICPAEWFPADGMEGNVRVLRMDNFDMYDPAYPNLLINEVIPLAAKNHGITITDDPDRRLVMGSSSGAIASWNIAWFRNDSFHRVYLSSPSFLAMGRGYEYPFLMYKYETKPIRVYLEYSENEGDDYFGSLVAVAKAPSTR
jgi:enterochelin esterase-like enzyme